MNEKPLVRCSGISEPNRRLVSFRYRAARTRGCTHKEARRESLYGFATIWVYLMIAGLQILFHYLKKWWESEQYK